MNEKPKMATSSEDLLSDLMNPNIPKSEREHAAVLEIERLVYALSKRNLPDVLTQEYGDSAQYIEGWNECREVMAGMMK
jgi:hypothetical protein